MDLAAHSTQFFQEFPSTEIIFVAVHKKRKHSTSHNTKYKQKIETRLLIRKWNVQVKELSIA